MIVISNIKQKFGQDLQYVQRKIVSLNNELNSLLLHPVPNAKKITYTRGKLIKYMQQEIDLTQNYQMKRQKKQLLNFEINKHKQQLNTRIKINKGSIKSKISSEIGLKIKKTINSYKQIPLSNNKKEFVGNITKSFGSTLSTVGSVAKIPTIGVTKILRSGAKLTAKILISPLHIYAYLFSKLINPNTPYKGKMVGNMSNGLEKVLKKTMEKQEQIIRRI